MMKVEIVSTETIKPSSPTPKSFTLSLLDQVSPPVYTKLFFFYQNTSGDSEEVVAERTRCLKASLSEVLTHFYPLAGQITNEVTVSLGEDDGAEFSEARVDCSLSKYLEKPTPEMFTHLVPSDHWELCAGGPLLMVQANFFKCGGLAIGMSFSHKVTDAATFTSFITSWANIAVGKSDKVATPDFSGSLTFPGVEGIILTAEDLVELVPLNNQTRRFVFSASKIAALQEKATVENVRRPSRMETITTFVWRVGMKMSMSKAGGSSKPSFLITPVNIRRRLPSPVCDDSFGNLCETLIVPTDGGNMELPHLISLLREKSQESREAYEQDIQGPEFKARFMAIGEKMMELMPNPQVMNAFTVTSWSKFPFYEADFGWGKPTWVATHNPTPYITMLMDTKDGTGIEVWVNFSEEEMAIFASDEELLAYASPNPSALS